MSVLPRLSVCVPLIVVLYGAQYRSTADVRASAQCIKCGSVARHDNLFVLIVGSMAQRLQRLMTTL